MMIAFAPAETITRPGEGRKEEDMTLGDKIKTLDSEMIVSLKNKYGIFWTGKAKFVFNTVTVEAWNGTHIEVIY